MKLRVERPSGSAEGRRVLKCSLEAFLSYLLSHGLVTYSIPDTWELDPLDFTSHEVSYE